MLVVAVQGKSRPATRASEEWPACGQDHWLQSQWQIGPVGVAGLPHGLTSGPEAALGRQGRNGRNGRHGIPGQAGSSGGRRAVAKPAQPAKPAGLPWWARQTNRARLAAK